MKRLLSLVVASLPILAAPLYAQEDGMPQDTAIEITVLDSTLEDMLTPAEFAWMVGDSLGEDTVITRAQHFDAGEIQGLRADRDLDYDSTLHVNELPWDRFMHWLSKLLDDLFGTGPGRWVFSHLYWGILAFTIGFLLYYFRKRFLHGGFNVDAERARQVTEMEEDIQGLDLDGSIANAEHDGDWRLAVRYQYLKVLRLLVDDGSIQWEPRHTDRDYLRQLTDPTQRAAFDELSFLFKWIWYGDAPVDEARYRQLLPAFERFNSASPRR